jgi:hypothetical protein
MNNTNRKIMAHRMRTSIEIMHRSYFKNVYNSLDNSCKAKIEIKEAIPEEIKEAIPIKTKKEIGKEAWVRWYAKDINKELHRERVKKSGNNPKSYAKRMVRELNANKITFNSIKQSTIDKYEIKKNDEGKYYTDLK